MSDHGGADEGTSDLFHYSFQFFTKQPRFIAQNEIETDTKLPQNAINDRFWKMLEQMIHEEPQYWLWSHDRWKFKRP